MKSIRIVSIVAPLLALTGGLYSVLRPGAAAPLPATDPVPGEVRLVSAQPFALVEPYQHTWRAEQPLVSSGWLAVLEAPRSLLEAKQTYERVLYVGNQTAERLSQGSVSGKVVVLVPSELGVNGLPLLDLASQPIWFGTEELPERVDAARIQSELHQAVRHGQAPRPSAEVSAALALGGPMLVLGDRAELEFLAADLIRIYSPDEVDQASGMQVPQVR